MTQITDHVAFDPALGIKFTIYRRMPSGTPGGADIFGSQQHGPLLDLEIPGPDCASSRSAMGDGWTPPDGISVPR